MARISVVIPVYGVAEFLPCCLDSILASGDPDLEVIAVDDASPDSAGQILAGRAADDPRLRVITLDRNRGQGHARNHGLDAAAGDYVWFVDGDDALAAGAIAAVSSTLARVGPDVLLVDWESWHDRPGRAGRAEPNPDRALLRTVPRRGCTLADQPRLINLTMTAWSKVYRRDFLRGLGVSFAAGIHEDIPVTCAALLSAEVVAAVDRVCYRYRRRPGSAMTTTSARQLAVFDAYGRVFERLARRDAAGQPATGAVRAAVFERAMWHYTTVLETTGPGVGRFGLPGLVPRSDRRRFFRRMHEDFVRYRPAGYRHPPGPRGAKLRLVERNAYVAYSLLEPLNQARVALRGLRHGR
ncbi:MAG: glycosyltransferase family 2 protein [Streptosporangiaceae bacterium]